jgi:hypothetical protein
MGAMSAASSGGSTLGCAERIRKLFSPRREVQIG